MNDFYDTFQKRQQEDALRRRLLHEAIKMAIEWIDPANTMYAVPVKGLDDAAKALADKLREPDMCQSCGQEVKLA